MDLEQLRDAVAAVSVDDLHDVHGLYLASRALWTDNRGTDARFDTAVVARRAERAMGLAIRAAQARGEMNKQGQSRGGHIEVQSLLPTAGQSTEIYALVDGVSDDLFEEALLRCAKTGIASRRKLMKELDGLREDWEPPAAPPTIPRVRPTKKGRRTIEHMAIQLNAIAMGVKDLDPGEVDKEAMRGLIFQAREDIGVIRGFLRKVMNGE